MTTNGIKSSLNKLNTPDIAVGEVEPLKIDKIEKAQEDKLNEVLRDFERGKEDKEKKRILSKKLEEGILNSGILYKSLGDIKNIYNKLDPNQKKNFEDAFKTLNLKGSVESAKQREIVASIEIANAIEDVKEESQELVKTMIHEKFKDKQYQEALDIAILSAEMYPKNIYFYSAVMGILQNTPTEISLKIKDKKISTAEKNQWIKKMFDNVQRVSSGLDTYDSIGNEDMRSLDEKVEQKKVKERKLQKEIDENLPKVMRRVNIASALNFLNSYTENTDLTAEKLNSYIPKNGKSLGKGELEAMNRLFQFKTKNSDKYQKIELAYGSGNSLKETLQVGNYIDQILTRAGSNPKKTLQIMLSDVNLDGMVVAESQYYKRSDVDKGRLFGPQIAKILDDAILHTSEKSVVENISGVIGGLHGFEGFGKDITTADQLIEAFKSNPTALLAFRDKLYREPDQGFAMLRSGTDYAERHVKGIERKLTAKNQFAEIIEKLPNDHEYLKEIKEGRKNRLIDAKDYLDKYLLELEKQATKNSTPELEETIKQTKGLISSIDGSNLDALLDSDEAKKTMKELLSSSLALAASSIKMGDDRYSTLAGGVAISYEKLNEIVQKTGIIDSVAGSVGIAISKTGPALAFGVGTSKSWQVSDTVRFFSGSNLSWSPQQPTRLNTNAYGGGEVQLNKKKIENSLDRRSAQYIGGLGHATIVTDFKKRDVQADAYLGASLYWRRDKMSGLDQKLEGIKPNVEEMFEGFLKPLLSSKEGEKSQLTLSAIENALRNQFANTKGENLTEVALLLHDTIVPYLSLSDLNDKDELITAVARDLTDVVLSDIDDQDKKAIVNEGWHVSQISSSVIFGVLNKKAQMRIGALGLTLTKYNMDYEEDKASFQEAIIGMNDQENFEAIKVDKNAEDKIQDKLSKVEELLGVKDLLKKDGDYMLLDPSVFYPNQAITLMVHPDLAPYMILADGKIAFPNNADISLGKIYRGIKENRILTLGAQSNAGCYEVVLKENDDRETFLDWKDQEKSDKQFASAKEGDLYKTEIVTKFETTPVNIDGDPNTILSDLLTKNGDLLVKYRLADPRYRKFLEKMKEKDSRKEGNLDEFKALLPEEIRDNVHNMDDIRYVYASLSRVSQTRDKQLEGNELKNKAEEYLKRITLNDANKQTLGELISKVSEENGALNDNEREEMKKILNIKDGWHVRASLTPAEKLLHLLTPVDKLAKARTNGYASRLESEMKDNIGLGRYLLNVRDLSIGQMNETHTAVGEHLKGWIGAVAGYDLRDEIDDKFVNHPKMINNSLIEFNKSGEYYPALQKHYLNELLESDKEQFDKIKADIISMLRKDGSRFAVKANQWEKESDENFIDAIVEEKHKNAEGEEKPYVTFDMMYGFFADCVNETVLLGNFNVVKEVKERVSVPNEIYSYEATVGHNGVTVAKQVTLGVAAGGVKEKSGTVPDEKPDKEPENSGTIPTKKITLTENEYKQLIAEGKLKEVGGNNIEVTMENGDTKIYHYRYNERAGFIVNISESGDDRVNLYFYEKGGKIFASFEDNLATPTTPNVDNKIPTSVEPSDFSKKVEEVIEEQGKRLNANAATTTSNIINATKNLSGKKNNEKEE